MRKVGQRAWFRPALSMLLFLGALLLGAVQLVAVPVRAAGNMVGTTLAVEPGSTSGSTLPTSDSRQGDCTSERHTPYFGDRVVIDVNEVACTDLTLFGGTVAINGEVKGKVVTFGGNIKITGTVEGDIYVYGGSVTLLSGSHVHGDIHISGGHWVRDTNSQLDGSVIDRSESLNGLLFGNGGFSFPFWSLLTWLALGLALTSLLPEHVTIVRTTVADKMRRSLVIGLLSILLAPPVLIVLIALIVPIPLAIIVALGLLAAWAFGTVAVGWLIGDAILRRVAPHRYTRNLQVVVGLATLVLAGSLPYIGWLISIGVGMLGLGAVFLSRFGTRLYGKPRQPLTLY